jgi:hypothetical protein
MFGLQIYRINTYHKDDENWKKEWGKIVKVLEKGNDEIGHLKNIYNKKLNGVEENEQVLSILDDYEELLFDVISKMNTSLYNGLVVKSDYTYHYIRRAVKLMKEVIKHMKARNRLMSRYMEK